MELEILENNKNLKQNINLLKNNEYKYIIKANDKLLGGWGGAEDKKHIQLIACKNDYELGKILNDLYKDSTFNYISYAYIEEYKKIYNWTKGKSFTIRNQWARAFR